MKDKYERTELVVNEFDAEDVIATSGGATEPTSIHYDDYEGQGYFFE